MSGSRVFSIILGAVVVLGSVGGALALDRRVVIQNNTSYTMREFYASSTGQKTWQEDILGKDMLGSGEQIRINIDDGTGYCKYDLRAVFEGDREAVQSNVNVCELATFTFND